LSKNVQVLKHFESPKEAGVYFRLVCLTGPNKGEAYILKGSRIVIGRSEKADIPLKDTKASREHAEVTRVADNWVVTDLGSQNGIVVNDKKVTQKQLVESDKLIVGQTVFKFARVEVAGKVKVQKDEDVPEEGGNKKTFIPFLIIIGFVVALFLIDDEKKADTKKDAKTNKGFADVTADYDTARKKKQAKEDKAIKEKLAAIYQRGQREEREGNYFRAIHEYNLALIISPGDSHADFYLRKTKERLDQALEEAAAAGQRDEASIKYQNAIMRYCQIIRLLYTVPEDPRYKSAEERIKILEGLLGLDPNETDCLKKPRTDQ
jgi:pSer/pThr/pTyr-binding forkhead associated (FHA) protein